MSKRRPFPDQLSFDWRVKRCPDCEQERPGWDFAPNKRLKYGLAGYCNPCWRIRQRAYYAEYMKDPAYREKRRKKSAAWDAKNLDRRRAIGRKSHRTNIEARRLSAARWQRKNAELYKALQREWAKANPDKSRAYCAARRARRKGAKTVHFTAEQLAQRWAYYNGRCWLCGDEATATDHVKPLSKGGAHMLCNLRPICVPCNSVKHARWPFEKNGVHLGGA